MPELIFEDLKVAIKFHVNDNKCWICTSHKTNKGYPVASIKGKKIRLSRLLYYKFKEGKMQGMFVCHKCDNPNCINPEHLFLGTPRDNIDDMLKKGRHGKKRTGKGVLSDDDLEQIKKNIKKRQFI